MTRSRFRDAVNFLRFGLSGLPGFLLAIGVNILLIEVFHWPKPLAYLLVVWIQMTLGFAMCRVLVFPENPAAPILSAYLQFALSMGLIRIADWSLYTALVEIARFPYVLTQVFTTVLFLGVKFFSAKAIFRPKSTI